MTSLLLFSTFLAQPPVKADDRPPAGHPPVPLLLTPVAAPVPALRYELLPPARSKSPGNAAVGYYRAALLRPAPPKSTLELQKQNEQEDHWLETPVHNLAPGPLKEYLKAWQLTLRELDDAARSDRCDWQQVGKLKPEDVGSLLPVVQVDREMIRYLSLRCRVELAEKRFDDAVHSVQTGLQMGKYVTEGPTMIQALVGIALTNVVLSRVEEFIQQPGAPNLYWALAALPRPLLDPRPSLDGEFRLTTSAIPGLADLERGPVPAEVADRAFDGAMKLFAAEDAQGSPLTGRAAKTVYITYHHGAAKKDLIARGWKPAQVDAMPPAQAVLLRTAATYRELWDDQAKLFFAPQPFARAEYSRLKDRIQAARKDAGVDPLMATFALVFPAVEKVQSAFTRTERKLAILQAVEAIRLHAAAAGHLPTSLDDVTVVPVPADPGTGKPFVYALADGTATLVAPAPAGESPAPHNSQTYELRLRPGK